MKQDSQLDIKIDGKSEAELKRRPDVPVASNLQHFSRRLKHLKLWINAKLDAHHQRELSLRVHRQNRTD
jgi:cytidylate kinase